MEIETVKSDVGMKWEMVRLSNIAEIIAGQSPESKYYNDKGEGIPFFQGKADFRIDYPIVRYWCTQPTKIAKPMDILMSVRAPVGPTNICDIEACIGRGLAAIRAGDKLYYKYLYFYFKTIEEKLASQGNGSTFSAITTSVIKDLQIPLPPLPIQRRIAEILDAADALKRKDQQLLKKYDELAQAIFMDMFGDPVKNEKGWEVTTIQEMINVSRPITYGILKPGEDIKPNGVPYIRVVDIKGQKVLTDQVCHTSIEISSQYKRSLLKAGDILYSIRGHVGRSCIVPNSMIGANITQDTARLDFTGNLNNVFAFGYLNTTSFDKIVRPLVRGAAVKGLNLGDLRELPIPTPPISLQAKYEKTINLIWQQNDLAIRSYNDSKNNFNALLQKAFKGELVRE